MPVTRKRLEKLIAALKERETFRFDEPAPNRQYDALDVYPALQDPSTFSPGTSGSANAFLSWTAKGDEAFAANGELTRPLAMRWGGDWIKLQLAFLEAGWVTRIESDPTPVRGFHQSGTLVLTSNAEELDTDLRRMLEAFAAMRKRKVIALANPGWTQSAGWESVAEIGNHNPNRTAVFWHSQSHERAFDRSGRLTGHLYLHWRGDETQILEPLRAEGFELDAPPNEDTAIIVRAGPCPEPGIELPPPEPETAPHASRALRGDGLTECLRFDADDPKPVASLAFSRHSPPRLVVALGSDIRGSPRRRSLVYELAHAKVLAELPSHSPFGGCGGLHFLPDGRLLYSLADFPSGGQAVCLRVWREGSAEAPEFARYPMTHVAQRCLSAVDAEFKTLAVTTSQGIVLRGIGDADAPLPMPVAPVTGVRIRKKNAAPPKAGPWDEVARRGGEAVDAYAMLAMSPDAKHLLWTADGSHHAVMVASANDAVLWTTNFFEDHTHGRSLKSVLFSTSGEQLLALVALSQHEREQDGRIYSSTAWQTRVHRTADGVRAWPALEKALIGATCLSFHPLRPELAAGFDDGHVRLFAFPTGEPLASVKLEKPGGVTAIAFDARGAELAVGTGKGEVFLFVRE